MHELKCKKCGFLQHVKHTQYDVKGNFLIVRISNEIGDYRLTTKIKNINLNNIIRIKNVHGEYKCISAILHISNGLSGERKGGHYKCYSRRGAKSGEFWLDISDATCVKKTCLPEDLNDICLLVFEKISSSSLI